MSHAKYGAQETAPLDDKLRERMRNMPADSVSWTDPKLARIVRLRLLTDPGFPVWDVSYCVGELRDGTTVRVSLPFDQLPRRGMRKAIVQHAIADGVHARNLGVFDAISTLI